MKVLLGQISQRIITGIAMGFVFWIVFMQLPTICFSLILGFVLFKIITVEWPRFFNIHKAPFWVLMPFYPILPFMCMIFMNQHTLYRELLFLLFVIVPAHDTGSYIFGSVFGRKKIAQNISAGKTWEGFWGGYFSACISIVMLLYGQGKAIEWAFLLPLTLIVCILGLLGDLFESYLKRRVHIKDSGSSLPGHGGYLDRFDGIMFAAVFFVIFRHPLLKHFGILEKVF